MLERYERIIEGFRSWYPNLYERTVECRPSGRFSILARLNDGSRVEYSDVDNTIRDVSKYYDHQDAEPLSEEEWKKEFGRKLRRAIADKGINQERLSEMLGISRQMLTRYVRGTSIPSSYNLARLSEILDCDVRDLTKFGYIDED